MNGGKLRHRITLLEPNDTQNRAGESLPAFVPVEGATDLPASIEPLGSREFFAAAQVQVEADARIRIRWFPGVHERMRIEHKLTEFSPYEFEYYDITGIQSDKTLRRDIWLIVKKRSTEGFRQ